MGFPIEDLFLDESKMPLLPSTVANFLPYISSIFSDIHTLSTKFESIPKRYFSSLCSKSREIVNQSC